MARFQRGDVATVWQVWKEKDGSIGQKQRPAIIYDVIAEDHYCILIFGKDRTDVVPGFKIEQQSNEGKEMRLKKDSFVNVSKIVELRKGDVLKLIGYCPESVLDKIDEIIDENGLERP
jgi:hypothetical protein